MTRKTTNKSAEFEIVKAFPPFVWARESTSIKMHSTEGRFVTGPSNTLSAGVYVDAFQPGNCTGCGSEGVNDWLEGKTFTFTQEYIYIFIYFIHVHSAGVGEKAAYIFTHMHTAKEHNYFKKKYDVALM